MSHATTGQFFVSGNNGPTDVEREKFFASIEFDARFPGCLGVERERFIVDLSGAPCPEAVCFLGLRDSLDPRRMGYELSTCQVEDRTLPRREVRLVVEDLVENDVVVSRTLARMRMYGSGEFKLFAAPVGPEDMPLEIYPDPRYENLRGKLSEVQLRAACRVAGIHIHYGCLDMNHAIEVYNRLRDHLGYFLDLARRADPRNAERIRLYKEVASSWEPPKIRDPEHFREVALAGGFAENLRDCYWLVRITSHGTVEVRVFPSTSDMYQLSLWCSAIRKVALLGVVL